MPIRPDIVAAISQRLADRAGLELPAWIVEARTASRVAALEVEIDDYVALISSSRGIAELDELIEAVRVGESRLFRHRAQIAALIDEVIPALRLRTSRTLKVWSAGCSTGEEPYTLAAVLSHALPDCAISILATDVSADALAIARTGRYPAARLADVPDEWRDAFVPDGDMIRPRADIAALVKFERANLVDAINLRGYDLVWCRNVLIYFTVEARRRVIERIVAATAPGGYVFVGYSETLREVSELRGVRAGEAVYYVRDDGRAESHAAAPTDPRRERERTDRWRTVDRPELTPPPTRIPLVPPPEDVLALRGTPNARELTVELTARLARPGLKRLVIDLDAAELLDDDIAPVLRRARAAARTTHVEIVLRATRAGTRRWITRHALEES